uniref:Uncharacterized protein n=1 Tax=Siphoviridae sp. ctsUY14 TaxID=2825693 RepID=A0A8S5P617_9CAUD|nr:MAG TPA: hypothetical protein [Siphoviridae sp. ctsUY14]
MHLCLAVCQLVSLPSFLSSYLYIYNIIIYNICQ